MIFLRFSSTSSILWPFVVIRVCVPVKALCVFSFSNLFFPVLFLPFSHLLTVWSVMICPLLLRPHSASCLLFWGRAKGFVTFVLQLVKMNCWHCIYTHLHTQTHTPSHTRLPLSIEIRNMTSTHLTVRSLMAEQSYPGPTSSVAGEAYICGSSGGSDGSYDSWLQVSAGQ